RSGTSSPYHFGDTISAKLANYSLNLGRTCKVGSYKPNKFGLYDMHGNVWEWCIDWYDESYYGKSPIKDPRGPAQCSSRVIRGGSWNDNGGRDCRSALRFRHTPGDRHYYVGFRVAAVPIKK